MSLQMKPASVISIDLGIQPGGEIHKAFQMSCYKHMTRFVPMSKLKSAGDLRTIVDLSNPKYIVYEVPYAHAQYVGYTTGPVQNYTTPGTGPYWDHRMWSAEKTIIEREMAKKMNHGGR